MSCGEIFLWVERSLRRSDTQRKKGCSTLASPLFRR
jgi:hypothetical protein